jgi:hypothetical protein
MFSTPAGETAERIEKLAEENGEVKKILRYFERSKIFCLRGSDISAGWRQHEKMVGCQLFLVVFTNEIIYNCRSKRKSMD